MSDWIRRVLCRLFGHKMSGGHINQCTRCFGIYIDPDAPG